MGQIQINDFFFEHVLEYEENMERPIPTKGVLGKCGPTPEATSFYTNPRTITIRARLTSSEKTELWNLHKECAWQELYIDEIYEDDVWLEQPTFKWDSELGCGWGPNNRPWIVTLKLICKTS